MPTTCVAFSCNNVSNLEKGKALNIIPFFGDDCAEARKRRKKWDDFYLSETSALEADKITRRCARNSSSR